MADPSDVAVRDIDNTQHLSVDGDGHARALPPATWTETNTATNAKSTATHAASEGTTHYVTEVSASYESTSTSGVLELLDGSTTIQKYHVHDGLEKTFSSPIKITTGNKAEVSLDASGTADEDGTVNLAGYSV